MKRRDTETPKKTTANTAGPYSYSFSGLIAMGGVGPACRLNKLSAAVITENG